MSKDAIMMIVDAGYSMDQSFSENSSRLKVALECCKLTLQQKLFNNSTHEVGLMLFGDNETDLDGNSVLLHAIGKPDIALVRKVEQLSQVTLCNTKPGGDIFHALETALDHMVEHCGKKKYNKRIFIFSNGKGKTNYNHTHLNQLSRSLRSYEVKLNIIPIDFMETYDPEHNILEGEVMMDPEQEHNSQLLMQLKESSEENIQIFPTSLAIELYKRFRKREVTPMGLFKGNLEIAPGLAIGVSTYKAVRKERLKSLCRYDMTVPFDPMLTKEKDVIPDVVYTIAGDDSGAIVDKDNQVNAYSYGPHLVPISGILEQGSKILEEKNFKLLGFVDKSKVPRHCLMGEVDIVVPNEDVVGRKLFTSFVYSMLALNRYAIARYVPRTLKNGISPKLTVLIPYRSTEREMFYLVELPTVEDVKDYQFNPLKQSTEQQQQLVHELVHKMMLYRKVDDEEIEEVKVENTFNPVRQYFFQSIFHRALINEGEIPELDPVIKTYMKPEEDKFNKTEPLMKHFKKEFKFVRKELARDKVKERAVLWKDILDIEQGKQSESDKETMIEEEFQMPSKKFLFEQEDDKFEPSNPIISFRKMITNNKKDLVKEALEALSSYINTKAKIALAVDDMQYLVTCSEELRKGCMCEKEENYWDNWLEKCGNKHEKLYEKLKEQGLGYLARKNEEIFKVEEGLHALQAMDFEELD